MEKEFLSKKYSWGLGIENETYLQFEKSLIASGAFIQTKIGKERYSNDYRKCYKKKALDDLLKTAFLKNAKYKISRMLNSHSIQKQDINLEHKTLKLKGNPPNQKYLGKSIIETFLEQQPHNIKSLFNLQNQKVSSIHFDGDTIEFITKYYENQTVEEACMELKELKDIFISELNNSSVLKGKVTYPQYNIGLNIFMTNLKSIVLFNNGTYHFHITLPNLFKKGRIVDYKIFSSQHMNAIYLLQWFEPFFIATLGSPDIMEVASRKYKIGKRFSLGSMRNTISRYIGVGTYNKSMPKGKLMTYNVDEFRKLLKFQKEDKIWWRDKIEEEMDYQLLPEIGLDFNSEKLYQSGFEFRLFDEFPEEYLNDVLLSIILICEHSLNVANIEWAHNSVAWNNLVFKTLKNGYTSEIDEDEKDGIIKLLKIIDPKINKDLEFKAELDKIKMADDFFFKILEILFDKYKEKNVFLDIMCGKNILQPPKWNNYNKYQVEKHLNQIESISKNR